MDQKDFGNVGCSRTNLGSTSCEANDKKQQESFETTVNAESNFESPTPEKPDWGRKSNVVTSLAKNLLTENFKNEKECSGELSDDHKILVDLFNKMDTSIRLLRLRKKTTSLKNISAQVEVLASRKLLAKHIAQMKYVLPDAVQIEKILSHDEESLLMYPDLKITLRTDFLESSHANQSPSMTLCKAFHASVLKFVSLHAKDTEIPEAILPEPFNSGGIDLKKVSTVPSPQLPPTISSEESSLNASHLPSSFRKSTFQSLNKQAETTDAIVLVPSQPEVACDVTKVSSPLPVVKTAGFMAASTPNRECKFTDAVMMETPDQRTPQRPLPTPSDKFATEKDGGKVTVTKSARKLQFLAEPKAERAILDGVAASFSLDDNEEHVNMGEASSSTGEKTLASLPSTFDVVYLISRSNNPPLITKKELVHKILSKNLEIEETSEVEEHLATLEELYPEWICKKTVPDGEVFYSVKHISDPKAVRARLVNAI